MRLSFFLLATVGAIWHTDGIFYSCNISDGITP